MEELIKANKAHEMTVNGIKEKYDEVIRTTNDAILEATKIGDYAAHILFDPLPAPILDRVYDALIAAGYEVCGLSDEDIFISWENVEADEPPTKPTAADMLSKVDSLVGVISIDNSEDLDDYERECAVKVGHLRDWVSEAIKYAALVCAGVDNWEWYSDAMEESCKEWNAEDMDEVTSKYWEHLVDNGFIRV